MIIPIRIPCHGCGSTDPVDTRLDDSSANWICPICKHENESLFSLDFTIGYKLLARSIYEFTARHDNSMSIVLSATALECELTQLFRKWMEIETLNKGDEPPSDETIEEMLRKFGNISDKIEKVGRFLHPDGIDRFAESSVDLRPRIEIITPSLHLGSLANDFQRNLFWPRNRILHNGHTGYGEEDSARCYSIAELGLALLREMDKAKQSLPEGQQP